MNKITCDIFSFKIEIICMLHQYKIQYLYTSNFIEEFVKFGPIYCNRLINILVNRILKHEKNSMANKSMDL